MSNVEKLVREAREHDSKATRGPWEYTANGGIKGWSRVYLERLYQERIAETYFQRDAEFIAWAREGVPRLCDALEEREREVERLREETKELHGIIGAMGGYWVRAASEAEREEGQ